MRSQLEGLSLFFVIIKFFMKAFDSDDFASVPEVLPVGLIFV